MPWPIFIFMFAVAVLAPIFGVDTRDGCNWKPIAPSRPTGNPSNSRRNQTCPMPPPAGR